MTIESSYRTWAYVLSEKNYKESSKIIRLYTRDLGKISLIVLGAQRPKSRVLAACKEMTKAKYILEVSRSRYYIQSVQDIDANLDLAQDIGTFLTAKFMLEVIDRTMVENYKDQRVYDLLDTSISMLKKRSVNSKYIRSGFLIKYLSFIGLRPNLGPCLACGSKSKEDLVFSNNHGGLVCKDHLSIDDKYSRIDKKTILSMNKLLYNKFSDYEKIENIDKIETILVDFFKYNTEIEQMKSETILSKLTNIQGGS